MSAFVVSSKHIDALLAAGLRRGTRGDDLSWYSQKEHRCLAHDTATATGQMLMDACVRSVRCRYPDVGDGLPCKDDSWRAPYLHSSCEAPTLVQALKLVDCYAYQSWEAPEWPHSEACAFITALRGWLVVQLPGYAEAPWSL